MTKMIWLILCSFLSLQAFARSYLPSSYKTVVGVKQPDTTLDRLNAVTDTALIPRSYQGFTDLLPYVLGSPNQEGAGSCLYMMLTGTVEWWLARQNPELSRGIDGPVDLSERFFMNIAGVEENESGVDNWKTDSIDHLNQIGFSILNKNYRYTKGWFKESDDANEPYVVAEADEEGALYGTSFNWIDLRSQITGGKVMLPQFNRRILFADPESNQWNVAVAPKTIVKKVKQALLTHKSPINVIYNHYGYWHAVTIVGFDDDVTDHGCSFTDGSSPYLLEQSAEYRTRAGDLSGEARVRMLKRARRYQTLGTKLSAAYEQGGGCQNRGVFYVRDSLYSDPDGPEYDYDLEQVGEETPLAKQVILREYEWLTYLSNHIVQIFPDT